ncbi:Protein SFI1 like protein [Chelonia mydas]|uniref:Protein SFI1 like protein n=1 Tax=Chelonia mydas TaxID=8469 RepID=M7BQ31_CHEMY|nr:Protein SFI1 like protein [Chelonia mydas]
MGTGKRGPRAAPVLLGPASNKPVTSGSGVRNPPWILEDGVYVSKQTTPAALLAEKQKLRWTWQHWLIYIDVRRTKHRMRSEALAFRETSTLRVSWRVWTRRLCQKCTDHEMNTLALQHWAQSLQFRAWLQWMELYLHIQHDKQKEAWAVNHHQHWELRRCMKAWLGHLQLQREKKHQDNVVLCMEGTWKHKLAEKHHRHHLLRFGFNALRKNIINARLQQMRRNLAHRQHQVMLLQSFWNRWKCRLEQEEEEHQRSLTLAARNHYRELLMRQVFDTWWLSACQQRENRTRERMAILHFKQQVLVRFWCSWRRRTVVCLEERESTALACDHYYHLLLWKTFHLWKKNVQEIRSERIKEMKAIRFHYSKCLQWSWSKWRKYVGHRSKKWKTLVQADMYYQHSLLAKVLAAWKSYQQNIQCILRQVDEKEEEHNRALLRQVLSIWRENTVALVGEAKKAVQAELHYRRSTLSKVLLQWRDTTCLRVYCRQQEAAALRQARRCLDMVYLRATFLHWKEFTTRSLVLRVQLDTAAQHHQRQLLRECLIKWKQYHLQCIGKMLAQKQWERQETVRALWHWSLSLQGKVFDAWLGFAREQQRKKVRIEKAVAVYRAGLLKEGVTQILTYMSGMKQFRGQLQAQHQLKATGPHSQQLRVSSRTSEDCRMRHRGLEGREVPLPQTSMNKCSAQAGALLASTQTEQSSGNQLFQMDSTSYSSCPLTVPTPPTCVPSWMHGTCHPAQTSPKPVLLPPSSFMSRLKCESEKSEGQPWKGHPEAFLQDPQQATVGKERKQPNSQAHLLLHEDVTGKESRPKTAVESKSRQGYSMEGTELQKQLEAELQHIRQQMQHYHDSKQELKSCRRQARILNKWLEMSTVGTGAAEQDVMQQVQEELDQLEVQINSLTQVLLEGRHCLQSYITRVKDIRIALDI